MIIGLDLDGILADLVTPLLRFHNATYGTAFKEADVKSFYLEKLWGGTREEATRKTHEFYRSRYFRRVRPIPAAPEGTKTLVAARNALVVVTSRPTEVSGQTRQWLDRYFPGRFYDVIFTNEWSESGAKERKADVCKKKGIEVIVEDHLNNAAECATTGTRALLLDYPWNQSSALPAGVTRVGSWEEILQQLRLRS